MAAKVISSCPSRKSKSHDNIDKITLGASGSNRETDKFVLELLSQLPPSRELLQAYQVTFILSFCLWFISLILHFNNGICCQEKLEKYEREECELQSRIEACARLLDNGRELEAEIDRNRAEIEELKDDLEAVSIKLHEEKRINLKLCAENDQLRIKDVESQRKINLLLKMCGKADSEIVEMLDKSSPISNSDIQKHPKLKQLKDQVSYKQQKSSQSLELEVAHLNQQILDQERLHRTQLKEERGLWRKAEKIHLQDKNSLREKINSIQQSVSGLENQIEILTSQINKQKCDYRKNENRWLNDRSVLMRKIEFFEKYGTLEGTHTEQRIKARLAGDKKGKDKLENLEKDVEKKEREIQRNKEEILSLKNEIFKEKAKSEAAANILAKKTKSMTEKVNVLTDRCERVRSTFYSFVINNKKNLGLEPVLIFIYTRTCKFW